MSSDNKAMKLILEQLLLLFLRYIRVTIFKAESLGLYVLRPADFPLFIA